MADPFKNRWIFLVLIAALIGLPTLEALAQDGGVRAQGKRVDREATPSEEVEDLFDGPSDPREAMRQFVQDIRAFARRYDRGFMMLAMNSLNLITKPDPMDEATRYPAQTFIRAIDGVLQEGVWYGVPDVGKPTDLKRRKLAEAALAVARDASLPAFVLDYVADNKSMNDVFRRATKLGATAYPARAKGFGLNKVPKTPRRPYREEAGSILSLKDVNNFIVIRDSSGFGRQDEFALKMHQNNYDMVIVDVQHGDEPLTKQAVETLKYKISGGKRPVLAYINIGAAESYRYYWQSGWGQGSPPWIEMSYPENPDAYYVEFWDPEWQDIIAGGTNSYIYGIIALGFDGVLLDGLDTYKYFEGDIDPDAL